MGLHVLLLVLFSLCCLTQGVLHRHEVPLSNLTLAVCNDGSPAKYFLELRNTSRWVIYLQGGGGCMTSTSCADRDVIYRSSQSLPSWTTGVGMLSDLEEKNPALAGSSKVLMWYCSSDLWMGNNRVDGIEFRGERIFQAVINDTLGNLPIPPSEIVLAGESAGGWGAFYHSKSLAKQFPDAKIALFADSSLWAAAGNLDDLIVDEWGGPSLSNSTFYEAVQDTWHPSSELCRMPIRPLGSDSLFPCCLDITCAIRVRHVPPSVAVFVVQPLLDAALTAISMSHAPKDEDIDAVEPIQLWYADNILALSRYTNVSDARNFQELPTGNELLPHAPLTTFQPACTLHIAGQVSDLWLDCTNPPCTRDSIPLPIKDRSIHISHTLGSYLFKYDVSQTESTWNDLSVDGRSLMGALSDWVELVRRVANVTTGMPQFAAYVDDCRGVSCNPTCPETVTFSLHSTHGSLSPFLHTTIALSLLAISLFLCAIVYDIPRRPARKSQHRDAATAKAAAARRPSTGVSMWEMKPTRNDQNRTNSVTSTTSVASSTNGGGGGFFGRPRGNSVNEENITIATEELSYTTPCRGGADVRLLHGVSVVIPAGKLTALMGPSGCGKTTLLDVLACRRGVGEISGDIRFNNVCVRDHGAQRWIHENSGFVMQLTEPSVERLTVRENLEFAADLRLAKSMSCSSRRARVVQIINTLRMQQFQHVPVGGKNGSAGLSGGQRRRLALAFQLLKNPKVLFLDEPTSGLDSTTAFQLLQLLVSLTRQGQTVIISIHQPRVEMWELFHNVLVLSSGKVVFCGDPTRMAHHMSRVLPPDHAMSFRDASNPAHTLIDMLKFSEVERALVMAYIPPHHPGGDSLPAPTPAQLALPRYSARDKIFSLINRNTRAHKIPPVIGYGLACMTMCLVVSIVFLKRSDVTAVFTGTVLSTSLPALIISSFIGEVVRERKRILWLEVRDGSYRGWHFISALLIEVGCAVVLSSFMGFSVVYLMMLPSDWYNASDWFVFCCANTLANACHTAVVFIAEVAMDTPEYMKTVIVWYISLVALFGGFMVSYTSAPAVMQFIMRINPSFLMNAIGANVIFGGKRMPCKYNTPDIFCPFSSGNYVLKAFSMLEIDAVDNFVRTIVYLILACAGAVGFAEFKTYRNTTIFRRDRRNLKATVSSFVTRSSWRLEFPTTTAAPSKSRGVDYAPPPPPQSHTASPTPALPVLDEEDDSAAKDESPTTSPNALPQNLPKALQGSPSTPQRITISLPKMGSFGKPSFGRMASGGSGGSGVRAPTSPVNNQQIMLLSDVMAHSIEIPLHSERD